MNCKQFLPPLKRWPLNQTNQYLGPDAPMSRCHYIHTRPTCRLTDRCLFPLSPPLPPLLLLKQRLHLSLPRPPSLPPLCARHNHILSHLFPLFESLFGTELFPLLVTLAEGGGERGFQEGTIKGVEFFEIGRVDLGYFKCSGERGERWARVRTRVENLTLPPSDTRKRHGYSVVSSASCCCCPTSSSSLPYVT